MLTATIGEDLALQCNWLGTGGGTTVSSHRFAGVIISRMIA